MTNIVPVEYQDQRILTTAQIAEAYGTDVLHIQQNYKNNKDRYIVGKHYYLLDGKELKQFKDLLENFELVDKRAPRLYLWTEKGAFMHAKSLNTDQAWAAYEMLIDEYFHLKEVIQQKESAPRDILRDTHALEQLLRAALQREQAAFFAEYATKYQEQMIQNAQIGIIGKSQGSGVDLKTIVLVYLRSLEVGQKVTASDIKKYGPVILHDFSAQQIAKELNALVSEGFLLKEKQAGKNAPYFSLI